MLRPLLVLLALLFVALLCPNALAAPDSPSPSPSPIQESQNAAPPTTSSPNVAARTATPVLNARPATEGSRIANAPPMKLKTTMDLEAHPDYRSPVAATSLGIVGTLAPLGLLASGAPALQLTGAVALMLTPSMGQWYAGVPLTWGMGLRVLGGAYLFALAGAGGDEGPPPDAFTPALLLIGTGMIVDLATAWYYARRHNANITIAPTRLQANGTAAWGLGIGGTF